MTINGKGTILYTSIEIESKLIYYVVQQQYQSQKENNSRVRPKVVIDANLIGNPFTLQRNGPAKAVVVIAKKFANKGLDVTIDPANKGVIELLVTPFQADPEIARQMVCSDADCIISSDSDFPMYIGASASTDMVRSPKINVNKSSFTFKKLVTGQKNIMTWINNEVVAHFETILRWYRCCRCRRTIQMEESPR